MQLPLSAHVVRSLDCPRLIVNTAPNQCKNTDNSEPNNMYHLHVEIPENKSQHGEEVCAVKRPPIKRPHPIKAGVNVKAVLTSLNTAFLPISQSRFKRH